MPLTLPPDSVATINTSFFKTSTANALQISDMANMSYSRPLAYRFANPDCVFCQGLPTEKTALDCRLSFSTHGSIETLYSAEAATCTFCRLIRTIFERWLDSGSITCLETDHIGTDGYYQLNRKTGGFVLKELVISLIGLKRTIRVFFPTPPGDEDRNSPRNPWLALRSSIIKMRGHTLSDEAVGWAKYRLQECHDKHLLCRQKARRTQPPRLPYRVLEICQDHNLRIIENSTRKAIYACLSHCWGKNPLIKTTHASLVEHKDHIPFEKLPKTFRDTVTILRKLDIKYVWIDSLCIIQDSEADWLKESAKMADIYLNAYLTIAGTRAAQGSEGLFASTQFFFEFEGTPLVAQNKTWLYDYKDPDRLAFPLLTRGWVLQEMLLSSRVLHFCNDDLVFECSHAIECTCGPHSRNDTSLTVQRKFFDRRCNNVSIAEEDGLELGGLVPKYPDQAAALSCWNELLGRYVKLELTFEKDRLPAISALARRFAANYGCTYVAGIWKEDLHRCLLWQYQYPGRRSQSSTAPTWSWASIVTDKSAWGDAYEVGLEPPMIYCSSIDADCKPVSIQDPYGQLESAKLTLSGVLLPFMLDYNPSTSETSIRFDCDERTGGLLLYPDITLSHDPHSSGSCTQYFGLPFADNVSGSEYGEAAITGLLLWRRQEDLFERVGLWKLCRPGPHEEIDESDWTAEELHARIIAMEKQRITIV